VIEEGFFFALVIFSPKDRIEPLIVETNAGGLVILFDFMLDNKLLANWRGCTATYCWNSLSVCRPRLALSTRKRTRPAAVFDHAVDCRYCGKGLSASCGHLDEGRVGSLPGFFGLLIAFTSGGAEPFTGK
jgi:hypothetical protein